MQFFRVRLLGTAVSNFLLGYCLARVDHGSGSFLHLLPALTTVVLLYFFGMGLNDFRDRIRDQKLHPDRPLPSGRIKPSSALAVLVVCALGALGLTTTRDPGLGLATLHVLAWILLYNLLTKDHKIYGPIAMGAVRFAVVLLGATAARDIELPTTVPESVAVAAILVGGYVGFLTFFSLAEETPKPELLARRHLWILEWLFAGSIAVLILAAANSWTAGIRVALAWLPVFLWCAMFARRPIRERPPRPGLTTLRLLLGLFLLDLAILLSYDLRWAALIPLGLWIVTWRPSFLTRMESST